LVPAGSYTYKGINQVRLMTELRPQGRCLRRREVRYEDSVGIGTLGNVLAAQGETLGGDMVGIQPTLKVPGFNAPSRARE
jgi:hypothetical protein